MEERFFISGCQRSGTTMLCLVLNSHPLIRCIDESAAYDFLIQETKNSDNTKLDRTGTTLVGFKIPRFTEQLLWEEFSDPDYGVFPSFYKGHKVIHIIRNPLDVVSSMIKLKTHAGSSWLESYGIPILKKIVKCKNLSLVYKKKYEKLERQGLPKHLAGALYWEVKNQGLFDLLDQSKPVLALSYEKLVNRPKKELLKVCKFLGVEWNDHLLNHPKQMHEGLDENGLAIGGTDPRRAIDTNSIGGWRSMITEAEAKEIKKFIESLSIKISGMINDF